MQALIGLRIQWAMPVRGSSPLSRTKKYHIVWMGRFIPEDGRTGLMVSLLASPAGLIFHKVKAFGTLGGLPPAWPLAIRPPSGVRNAMEICELRADCAIRLGAQLKIFQIVKAWLI